MREVGGGGGSGNPLIPFDPIMFPYFTENCAAEATGLGFFLGFVFFLLLSTLVCCQPTELIPHKFSNLTPPPPRRNEEKAAAERQARVVKDSAEFAVDDCNEIVQKVGVYVVFI